MSNSKKSGPLYRITLSFDMNDEGCSVPELSIMRDSSTKTRDTAFGPLSMTVTHVPVDSGSLNQEQRDAIFNRFRLAADGWVHPTYKERARELRNEASKFLEMLDGWTELECLL